MPGAFSNRYLHFLSVLVIALQSTLVVASSSDPLKCVADALNRKEEGLPFKEVDALKTKDLPTGTTVWMNWNCKHCKLTNTMEPNTEFGTVQCGGCGHAHTDEVPFLVDENGKEITSSQAVVDGKTVRTFSDEQAVASKHDLEDPIHDHGRLGQGKKWQCPHCKASNFAKDYTCSHCAALRDDVPTPPDLKVEPYLRDPKNRVKMAKIAGGVVATVVVVQGVRWAVSTKEHEGEVTRTSWVHQIEIETYQPVTRRAWRHQITEEQPRMPVQGRGESPGMSNIRNCRREHFSDEEYQDGTKPVQVDVFGEEPYTVEEDVWGEEDYEEDAWVDNGDGSATKTKVTKTRPVKKGTKTVVKTRTVKTGEKTVQVPNMKTRPIYRDKCDYDTYEWQHKQTLKTSGVNPKPDAAGKLALEWPNAQLGSRDRATRSTDYKIQYSYEKGKFKGSMSVSDPNELIAWTPGAKVVVTRTNLGVVTKVLLKDR